MTKHYTKHKKDKIISNNITKSPKAKTIYIIEMFARCCYLEKNMPQELQSIILN